MSKTIKTRVLRMMITIEFASEPGRQTSSQNTKDERDREGTADTADGGGHDYDSEQDKHCDKQSDSVRKTSPIRRRTRL